jgi:hypothetical protein
VANRIFRWIVGAALVVALATLGGCAGQKDPPESSVSWLAPQTRSAKPFACPIPILSALPNADYQQIAIIEVTDDYSADNQEVYGLARRKACETGADALVILEDQRQKRGKPLPGTSAGGGKGAAETDTPEVGEVGHKGRVLNAVAIIYKNPRTAPDSSGDAR